MSTKAQSFVPRVRRIDLRPKSFTSAGTEDLRPRVLPPRERRICGQEFYLRGYGGSEAKSFTSAGTEVMGLCPMRQQRMIETQI
jgi:hypothetical protein